MVFFIFLDGIYSNMNELRYRSLAFFFLTPLPLTNSLPPQLTGQGIDLLTNQQGRALTLFPWPPAQLLVVKLFHEFNFEITVFICQPIYCQIQLCVLLFILLANLFNATLCSALKSLKDMVVRYFDNAEPTYI